jgi:glucose/arabinose dehydrogenase
MRITSIGIGLALALTAGAALSTSASAQALKATKVHGGFTSPLYVCSPPGDTTRLFVVEQGGRIRILKNGVLLGTNFINLGPSGLNKISISSEQGLLGLAFHPNYATNHYFFVSYTRLTGNPVIERYEADPATFDTALPNPPTVIAGPIPHPQSNHNGSCIQFGPDGKLYMSMGDGGNFNDTGTGHNPATGNAQDPTTLLGKMMRFDVDIAAPYIPADNPFYGPGAPLDEIWHLGLRNPWRFSFDRQTGDMYIGDVGQDAVEEVDFVNAGVSALNFGWRCMEGLSCTGLTGCTCNDVALTKPIKDYAQGAAHCSVIGGYCYRGCAIPGLAGTYFYGDYCSTSIWSFKQVGGAVTAFTDRTAELEPAGADTINAISSFGEDALGEIYIVDYGDGEIYRIEAASGSYADCNGNTIADACDISLGTSQDINTNGIPDECECVGFPPPFVYCTAKLNSQLCLPAISYTGLPKLAYTTPFVIHAAQILNQKQGLLFYGYGAQSVPFQGGTMCVSQPVKRTPVQNSGGSTQGTDCTGTFAFDMSAYMASGVDPALQVPGQQVNVEFWSRDPQDPFTTNTTDAVQFVVCN